MNKVHIINLSLFLLILILCIALVTTDKQQIISQMNAWKLLPEPETFTELYFNNSANLPSTIKVNKEQKFSFVIHNEEYKTMTYPYAVYTASSSGEKLIDFNSVTLEQDQYKTIKEKFSIPTPVTREEVIVNLKNLNQQIDFWIGVTR